ncbi:hypothetical protein SAMD00023353_0700100 [Rosellinia necatrix]|uniref:Uncharacterized protein n=1 Tax=Rosellinia necatrix TaxID=77044 RepID=A0A1S7ULM1_ROSNE|nr:hypothetical protein SAMD00023353_0700100 [Rosellinia necatrix]
MADISKKLSALKPILRFLLPKVQPGNNSLLSLLALDQINRVLGLKLCQQDYWVSKLTSHNIIILLNSAGEDADDGSQDVMEVKASIANTMR